MLQCIPKFLGFRSCPKPNISASEVVQKALLEGVHALSWFDLKELKALLHDEWSYLSKQLSKNAKANLPQPKLLVYFNCSLFLAHYSRTPSPGTRLVSVELLKNETSMWFHHVDKLITDKMAVHMSSDVKVPDTYVTTLVNPHMLLFYHQGLQNCCNTSNSMLASYCQFPAKQGWLVATCQEQVCRIFW
jgi:hypothetical protein